MRGSRAATSIETLDLFLIPMNSCGESIMASPHLLDEQPMRVPTFALRKLEMRTYRGSMELEERSNGPQYDGTSYGWQTWQNRNSRLKGDRGN
jgi:hypothetical protein